MKTRNITIFALALLVSFSTAFVNAASADSSRFGNKKKVEVHERYVTRDGNQTRYRYERREVRSGRNDRHDRQDVRWEPRDRYRDRDRWEYRHDHRYNEHRHSGYWRPHWHDHDGHVHFFFGWGLEHATILFGF